MKYWITALLLTCSTGFADPRLETLKQHIIDVRPTIEGWCSQEKAVNLFDLIIETRPDVYVEIGVFGGASLFPVAMALKYNDHGICIAVDPWDKIECIKHFDPFKDQQDLQWWAKINLNYIYYSFLDLLSKHDLDRYCKIIRATSDKAAPMIGSIDILFLDGNHSEIASTQDVILYLPKVKNGGYIWMNDTLWTDRQAAVDLLLKECDVIKLIDNGNCILFRKR